MSQIKPLTTDQLYRYCEPDSFDFDTTAELDALDEIIGQGRAIDATRFGIGMRQYGYNIYVMGPTGSGKHTMANALLKRHVESSHQPVYDWCYVNNFMQPHKPRAVRLPAGMGARLRKDMQQLVDELRATIPTIFEGEEYRRSLDEINEEFNDRQATAFGEIGEEANTHGIALLRTLNGFSFAPAKDGEVLTPEAFAKLSAQEQQQIERDTDRLREKLEKVIRQVPRWRREHLARVNKLNEDAVLFAVGHLIDSLRENFGQIEPLSAYLDEVQKNIIETVDEFRQPKEGGGPAALRGMQEGSDFSRYGVNLLVDHGASTGAPIIDEEHPTYQNLLGRVEHQSQFGTLVTNFMQIKPGALHLANGGYLLLDTIKLLTQPFSWEALKRALTTREIRIESIGQMYSLISTVSLEPEPIALDIKILLLGDRLLCYLLAEYDPEFAELFKVMADFEDEVPRNRENDKMYARLVGTLVRRDGLLAFDRRAVARVIEHCARRVEDAERLSTHMESLAGLVRESSYWAEQDGRGCVTCKDVECAIDAQIHRADRLRARSHEAIQRGILRIDTDGAHVGEINGLSVLQLGQFAFGQPTRISASTRLGSGEVVDIQREVKLGGSIHTKGVLILSAYLATRFAADMPLSLSGSLAFEQTYGHVDGDSASVAELCVLLSSLSGIPIRQSLAVTGSVDQHGRVQAIGGVNEKIEGFFDICRARGLTGAHGVLIPATNVMHLMLRRDVIDAVQAGQFNIYPIETVDQALECLTGVPAGEADADGVYPEGSVNRLVADRLCQLAQIRRDFGRVPHDSAADSHEAPHPEDKPRLPGANGGKGKKTGHRT